MSLKDIESVGGYESLFTEGSSNRNCADLPSRTRGGVQLRSGSASHSWPGAVEHPVKIIQVERSSVKTFHYDLDDEADALNCLTGGEKLWLLCPAGNCGALLQGLCGDDDSEKGFTDTVQFLRGLSKRQKSQIFFGVLDGTNTLYLPYGWCHLVLTWTKPHESQVCSMWYLELSTDPRRVEEQRLKASRRGRVGMRRSDAL